MKLHEVLTDCLVRKIPLKLLKRGAPLFGRTPKHNASTRLCHGVPLCGQNP